MPRAVGTASTAETLCAREGAQQPSGTPQRQHSTLELGACLGLAVRALGAPTHSEPGHLHLCVGIAGVMGGWVSIKRGLKFFSAVVNWAVLTSQILRLSLTFAIIECTHPEPRLIGMLLMHRGQFLIAAWRQRRGGALSAADTISLLSTGASGALGSHGETPFVLALAAYHTERVKAHHRPQAVP